VGAAAFVVRSQLARRRLPVVALALVVAVVVAVVAAGFAGARRTASVVERMDEQLDNSDVLVRAFSPGLGTDPEAGVHLARTLEGVDGVRSASVGVGFPVDAVPDEYFQVYASPDGSLYRASDRPILRSGRLPAADAPDEIAVNQAAVDQMGLDIGDVVAGPTLPHGSTESMFTSGEFAGFVGPELRLRVVGIVTVPSDVSGRIANAGPQAVASPSFAAAYGDVIDSYTTFLFLRTDDTSPELLQRVVAAAGEEVGDFEVNVLTTDELWRDPLAGTLRTVAFTVLAISVFLAAAGLLVVMQWVRREVVVGGADDATSRALGMTRRARMAAATGVALGAVVVGASLGAVLAVALSFRFPFGDVRAAEVAPGWRLDPIVVVVAVAVVAVLATVAVLAAVALTRPGPALRPHAGRAAQLAARLGLRPSTSIGVGLAIDPGRGPRSLPARSAALAAVVALAGMSAVVVVGSSSDAVVQDPARYGWTWSALPDVLSEDPTTLMAQTATVEGVDGLGLIGFTQVGVDGRPHPAMSLEVLAGRIGLAVLDGRVPVSDDEVAVSRAFADEEDIVVGGTLALDDPAGGAPGTATVVGVVVGPTIDDEARDLVLTPAALASHAQTEPSSYNAIRYAPGADTRALETRLTSMGFRFSTTSGPQAPDEVEQFRSVRGLFVGVLVLVALLGAAGLVHVLALSVRRRRGDLAVLRSMGFRRRDVRHVLSSQAVTSTLIGIVVGLPLGIILARTLWRLAVHRLGIVDTTSLPWWALAAIAGGSLVGAVLLAAPLGRAAARRPIAATLRAE
jgi:hypothetical protein